MSEIEQPPNKPLRIPSKPNYVRGAQRSVRRLAQLGFDPIGELVKQYRAIEKEIDYQGKLRTGEVKEMTTSGSIRAYRHDVTLQLQDKLVNIGKELLRYGYGRVPEINVVEEAQAPSFVVNLTAPGQTYVVSAPEPASLDFDEEDDFVDVSSRTINS